MKEFFVGLLVLLTLLLLSGVGFLLLPFIIVLSFVLRWLTGLALFIFAIWLVGKITLTAMEKTTK